MIFPRWCVAGSLLAASLVLASCGRKEQTTSPPGPPPDKPPGPPVILKPPILDESEPHAAGKKLYNASGCFRCHTMGGGAPPPGPKDAPLPPGPKGPDLAKVAGKPERDVDWFIAYVSDPKKFKPDAKMPPFEKKMNADELRALAEFLATLK